jgi:hypothetical protein
VVGDEFAGEERVPGLVEGAAEGGDEAGAGDQGFGRRARWLDALGKPSG